MTKIIPFGERVLVEVGKTEETTAGGIIIPQATQEEKTEGTVIAIGQGKCLDNGTYKKIEAKIGDKVLFGRYTGDELSMNGKKYRLIKESELFGKIVNEE